MGWGMTGENVNSYFGRGLLAFVIDSFCEATARFYQPVTAILARRPAQNLDQISQLAKFSLLELQSKLIELNETSCKLRSQVDDLKQSNAVLHQMNLESAAKLSKLLGDVEMLKRPTGYRFGASAPKPGPMSSVSEEQHQEPLRDWGELLEKLEHEGRLRPKAAYPENVYKAGLYQPILNHELSSLRFMIMKSLGDILMEEAEQEQSAGAQYHQPFSAPESLEKLVKVLLTQMLYRTR